MTNDPQSNITAFWSAVARDYEAHEGNVPAKDSAEFQAWIDAIARLLPPAPADVLDIACGTGFVSLVAAGLGHRVIGIDLSERMLAEARAEASRLRVSARFQTHGVSNPQLRQSAEEEIRFDEHA